MDKKRTGIIAVFIIIMALDIGTIPGCRGSEVKIKGGTKDMQAIDSASEKSSTKVEEVKLTADYFIPDISKKYIYEGTVSSEGKLDSTVTWSMDNQGRYVKSEEINTTNKGSVYHSLYKDTFSVQKDSVYCINRESYTEPFGTKTNRTVDGEWVMLKPALPGEAWGSTYKEVSEYPQDFSKTTTFVGFEEIMIMGKKEQAAHLTVTYKSSNGVLYTYKEDYWLVRNIGVAKTVKEQSSRGYVDTEKSELTAIQSK
ncbi:MAG: hypothetical protein ABRQ26_06930 [Syntrophomonadaceae bacterium]